MAFTVSLPELYRSIDVAWDDAIQKTQFIAKARAAQILLQNQTAKIDGSDLIQGAGSRAKVRTVRVHWLDACSVTTGAETDECLAATVELTDNKEDYALTGTRESSFKTSWKVHRVVPHEMNETIATGILKASKELDEYLSAQYFAFLAANNGTHEYSPAIGSLGAGDVWEIPAVDLTVDIMPEMILSAEFARFNNAYMLHGLNLFTTRFKAGQYAANGEGKGENNLFDVLPMFWDPVGASAASAADSSWLVNASSVALATGNFYDMTPVDFGGQHRMFKIASRNLPGVFYDVHEMETCTSDDMVVSYKLNTNFEFLLNPLGCTATRTGILEFAKV
jgi:hypothetical protein